MKEAMGRLAKHKKKIIVIAAVLLLCMAGVMMYVFADKTVCPTTKDGACEVVWEEFSAEDAEASRLSKTAPVSKTHPDYLFAGWYHEISNDEDKTVGYSEFISGRTYYAKFLPKHMLTMKAQVSGYLLDNIDVQVDGETKDVDDATLKKATIRFVSSIDNLHYKKIGFKVTYNGKTKVYESRVVYQQLAELSNDPTKSVSLRSPENNFCNLSNYFMTYSIRNVPESFYTKDFEAVPYWITKDGITVEGTPTKEIDQKRNIEECCKREITWVDPDNGNDLAWAGTRKRPYQTLAYAKQQTHEAFEGTHEIFVKDAFKTDKTYTKNRVVAASTDDKITYSSIGDTKQDIYLQRLRSSLGQKSVKYFEDANDYRLYPESQVTLAAKGHTEEDIRYREYGLVTQDYQITETTDRVNYYKDNLPIKYTQKYACDSLMIDGIEGLVLDSLGTNKLAKKNENTAQEDLKYVVKANFAKAYISEADRWNVEGQFFGNIHVTATGTLGDDLTSGKVYTVDNVRMIQARAKAPNNTDRYQLVLGFQFDINSDGTANGNKETAFRLCNVNGRGWEVQSYDEKSFYGWACIYQFKDTNEEDKKILADLVGDGVDFKLVRQGRKLRIFVGDKEITTKANLQAGSDSESLKKQGYLDAGSDINENVTGVLTTTDAKGFYKYSIGKNMSDPEYDFAVQVDGASIDVRDYENGTVSVDKDSYRYDFEGVLGDETADITVKGDRGYAPEKVNIGQFVRKDADELIVEPDGTAIEEDGSKYAIIYENQIVAAKFRRSLFWDAIDDNSDWLLNGQFYGKLGVTIPENGESSWLATEGDTYTYTKMSLDGTQKEAWIRLRYTTGDIITFKLVGNEVYLVGSDDGASYSNVMPGTVKVATLSGATGTDFSVETVKGGLVKVSLGGVSQTIDLTSYIAADRLALIKVNPLAQISMRLKATAGKTIIFPFELGNVDISVKTDQNQGLLIWENLTNPGNPAKIGDEIRLTIDLAEGYSFNYFIINDEIVTANIDMDAAVTYELVLREAVYKIESRFVKTSNLFRYGVKTNDQTDEVSAKNWEVDKMFGTMAALGVYNPDQEEEDRTGLLSDLTTSSNQYTGAAIRARDDDPKKDSFAMQIGFAFNNGEKFMVRVDNDDMYKNPDHYQIQVLAFQQNTFTTSYDKNGEPVMSWNRYPTYPLSAVEIEKIRSAEGVEFSATYDAASKTVTTYINGVKKVTYDLSTNGKGEAVTNQNTAEMELRIDGNEGKVINARYYLSGDNISLNKEVDSNVGSIQVVAVNGDYTKTEKDVKLGDHVTIKVQGKDIVKAEGNGTNTYLRRVTWDGKEVKDLNGDGTYTFTVTRTNHTIKAEFEDVIKPMETWGDQKKSTWNATAQALNMLHVTKLPDGGIDTSNIFKFGNSQAVAVVAKYDPSMKTRELDYQAILSMQFFTTGNQWEEISYRLILQDDKDIANNTVQRREWMIQSVNNKDTGWGHRAWLTEEEVRAVEGTGLEYMMRRVGSEIQLILDTTPGVEGGERVALIYDYRQAGSKYTIPADAEVRSCGIRLSIADNASVNVPYRIIGEPATITIEQPEGLGITVKNPGTYNVGDEAELIIPADRTMYCDTLKVDGQPIEIGLDGTAKFTIRTANPVVKATATSESLFNTEGLNESVDLSLQQLGILRIKNNAENSTSSNVRLNEPMGVGDIIKASAISSMVETDRPFAMVITLNFGNDREVHFRIVNNAPNNGIVRDNWNVQSYRERPVWGDPWKTFGGSLNETELDKLLEEGLELSVKRTAPDKLQVMLDGRILSWDGKSEISVTEHFGGTEEDYIDVPVTAGFRVDGNYTGDYTYIKFARNFRANVESPVFVGETKNITTTLLKRQERNVIYTTDDTDLISIADGKITGLAAGTATVTAVYEGEEYIFTVEVKVEEEVQPGPDTGGGTESTPPSETPEGGGTGTESTESTDGSVTTGKEE